MNWKKLPGFLIGFAVAALGLPLLVQWLMPQCIHYRAGCIGVEVWKVVGVKAGIGLLVAGTVWVAAGKIRDKERKTGDDTQ